MAHINLIPGEQGVRLSTLSPKYLHTNSTSHTWPFSAIAELIDNAYDPDVEASQLWIDIERYGFEQCLSFTDNGAGMDSLKLHKMLSFGFCEKEAKKDHLPVGHYGNGFKSGSMRLGKDAIVFTKQQDSRSVGYLSQTYLTAVKAQTILVPIVSWDSQENMVQRADGDKALQDILKHGLFKTKKELLHQFNEIKSPTGTKIIINQMRRTQERKYEFDFHTDYADIRIPDDIEMESNKYRRQERQNHIPESDYSLRAYCSILYLRPRMQIILRGKKVRTTVIGKSLSKTEVDTYRPNGVSRPIKVTFGFSQNKNHYGIMMYHRNRLIKPYVRVGYQLRANNLGVGVIGVIQCDYLQPTHNKQDFDYTKSYRSSMSALGTKLNDYWNEKKGKAQINSNVVIPEPKEVESVPDQLWVQCDNPECLKWRKLPPVIKTDNLPEKWYCRDHPDKRWRSCDVREELEDDREEVVQPYVKKQKKRLEKELEEKKKKEKEAKQLKEMELEVKSKELQKKDAQISRLMQQVQAKSKQQQSAIQQNQASVKPEAASPQKLQIKFVGPTVSRQQATPTAGTRKYLVHQTSDKKVILTPVTTHVTPQHTLTVKTHTTQTPNATITRQTPNTTVTGQTPNITVTRQIAQKPQMVVVQGNITPKRPILQKPTMPTSMPGQGPKMVNIVSKGTPTGSKTNPVLVINTGKVIPQPALHPKVGGPPVIIHVSSQAAAEKVKYLPTMVPIAAVVDPKVVSVHSLAMPPIQSRLSVATPGTSNVLIRPAITSTHINVPSPTLAVPSNLSARASNTQVTPTHIKYVQSPALAVPSNLTGRTSNTQVTPALGQTAALGPQTATLGQTAALGLQTATLGQTAALGLQTAALGPQTATLGQTVARGMQTVALGPQTATLGQTAALGPQTATIGQTVTPALQVNNLAVVQKTSYNYKPLESLEEVNRQATINTVSPVSAVMEKSQSDSTPTLSQYQNVTNPNPLGRQDVTVNNRYRYIAPSGQPAPQTNDASAQLTLLNQVKTPTVVKTEPQNSTSPNVSNLKRPHDQSKNSDEPVARKQKSDADVIIIDPPSPPPIRPISPQAIGIKQEPNDNKRVPNMDTSMPNMDTSMPNMDTSMPNMDTSMPNMDTSIPNMDLVPDVDTSMVEANGEKSEVDKNVPDVDTVIRDCNMDNIDKDVIDDVKSMSPRQQLQSLLNRTQKLKQLYSLRENVLKLLRVLVPELEVDDLNERFHDQTVDELLQQVLEQAERSELDNES